MNFDDLKNLPDDITKSTGKNFTIIGLEKDKTTGKTNKRPMDTYSPKGQLNYLKWKQNPDHLTTFARTYQLLQQQNDQVKKLVRMGLLLHENWEGKDNLIVVDIDHRPDLVQQARQGKITSTDEQAKVVQFGFDNDFYIEISQSGEGLHLIQMGHKHNNKLIRNDKFEYYDCNRWICLTGDCVHTTDDNCLGVDDSVFENLEKLMFSDAERTPQKPSSSAPVNNSPFSSQNIDDLVKKAMNAKNGQEFSDLYKGSSPSGDVSSDDMRFAIMLAFWTAKNPQEMDRIFRKSGRMRSKWDEIHSADGQTYGQMTINKAIDTVTDVYTPKTPKPQPLPIDKTKIKSNSDIINALARARTRWDLDHINPKTGHPYPIVSRPTEIIQILLDIVDFAKIYQKNAKVDLALYFYDYDQGIYSRNENDLESLILAVAPEMTVTKTRLNLLDTILKLPTSMIPVVQNVVATDKGRNLIAVGNGILNLKTKELTPFSPQIYVTAKIATDYNENATVEPIFNCWSWSHNLKIISDGDVQKLRLLWQVCKASIIGAYWLRQAVLLIDDGHGMTGKSTFEDALIGVVGDDNTAQLRLAEMSDETKLIDAVDKRLIIGDDNDTYTAISRYDYLNPVISSELIRVRNYYQKSQSTMLHAFVLQSCNGIPPFQNATQAFFNRLKIIKFNHRHNSADKSDWAVKHDYIKRTEFREWLLWYVVNKVHLGIALENTDENTELIAEAKEENDTIDNFVKNWLPQLQSTVIPTPWLYDYYATSCIIDGMKTDVLSQKSFTRNLMNNDRFSKHWIKKTKRPTTQEFVYDDVQELMNIYNSTRWGKDLKTWFPITSITTGDDDERTTIKAVTIEDYTEKIQKYHNACFVKL